MKYSMILTWKVVFDDTIVKAIGKTLDDCSKYVSSGRFQPTILFYQRNVVSAGGKTYGHSLRALFFYYLARFQANSDYFRVSCYTRHSYI